MSLAIIQWAATILAGLSILALALLALSATAFKGWDSLEDYSPDELDPRNPHTTSGMVLAGVICAAGVAVALL